MFQDKKDLLDLYDAVNDTNYKEPEELIIYILTDILCRCKTKVYRMLLAEYDEKKVRAYLRKEAAEMAAEEERKKYSAILAEKDATLLEKNAEIARLQKQIEELRASK